MDFKKIGNRYQITISPEEINKSQKNSKVSQPIVLDVRGYGSIVGPILAFFRYAKEMNDREGKSYYVNKRSMGKAGLISVGMGNFGNSTPIKDIAARLIFSGKQEQKPDIATNIYDLRKKIWDDSEFRAIGSLTEEAVESLKKPPRQEPVKNEKASLGIEADKQVRQNLLQQGFVECQRGILPPFALRGGSISMKPPTMDLERPPQYQSKFNKPAAAPMYAFNDEINKLSPKEQIGWFMDRIRKDDPKEEELFFAAKKEYEDWIQQVEQNPPKTQDDIKKLNESVLKFDTMPGAFRFNSQIEICARSIEQLAKAHKGVYDASKELQEVQKYREKARNRVLCTLEVANFVRDYFEWLKAEINSSKKSSLSPLDKQKNIIVYVKSADGYFHTEQMGKIHMDHEGVITLEPKDYNMITVSRLNDANEWEYMPIFIKKDEDSDRYQLKFRTDPSHKVYSTDYRIDFGVACRLNDEDWIRTEMPRNESFLLRI